MSTINLRIKEVLKAIYGGNATEMAKGTGIKRTTLNSVVFPSETSPGFDVLAKIGDISSPRISMEWLIRGEGDMFLPSSQDAPVCNSGINGDRNINNTVNDSEMLNRLLDSLEAKDRQLAEKDNQIASLLSLIKQG